MGEAFSVREEEGRWTGSSQMVDLRREPNPKVDPVGFHSNSDPIVNVKIAP